MLLSHVFAENPCQAVGGIVCGTTNLGSLLIDNCGMSQCGTALDVNAGGGITIPTIYATNTFFDTGNYGCRFRGTGTIARCLFSTCWFSSAVFSGFTIEQASIDGLDFEQCHFFGNAGYGINASGGGTRWSVNPGCRFAGNTTGGISIAPSSGANSQVRVVGSVIGPSAVFGANGVGITIAAGTYTSLFIALNDVSGNTGAGIIDNSTTVGTKVIKDNIGGVILGGVATLAATVTQAAATEIQVIGTAIPAGVLQVGSTYRLHAFGQATVTTAAGTITFRVRIGTTTLTGAIVASIANTDVVGTLVDFHLIGLFTVRSIGAAGTVIGMLFQNNQGVTGLSATTNQGSSPGVAPVAQAINTTVANLIELTVQISATTSGPVSFYVAAIEAVK